jgi:hypothetical protein
MTFNDWLKSYLVKNMSCLNYRRNLKDAFEAGRNTGLKEATDIMSNRPPEQAG